MTMLSTSSPIFLPKEIIFDMLSYLPVKSLLRFKCVCNNWNVITQDFQFICIHYKRSPLVTGEKPPHTQSNATDEFKTLCLRGLLLEGAIRPSHFPYSPNLRYRIRNPEMQHQILEIPNSQTFILNIHIVFDPDYQVLKLLSFVYDFHVWSLGYEVLDLRNEGSTYSWRSLNLPQKCRGETRMCSPVKAHSRQIEVLDAMGTAYSMWDTAANSYIGIDILDMVNDSYIGHTTFPTSYYKKNDSTLWNGKLAFAKIVNEELHVLVLDVYKKQIKWAEAKLIIKLPFLKDISAVPQISIIYVHNSKFYFWCPEKESICTFDIMTGKVTTVGPSYKKSQGFYINKPCLFTFKGMQSSSSFWEKLYFQLRLKS